MRNLYTEIVGASDGDPDSFIASEVNRDFMARLRIGIMANQAPVPDPRDGPPADIVFLEDVIARHASIEWYPEDAKPVETDGFIPTRWSRRRPSATDDMKAIVYLCCPVQDEIGWSYITAITTFIKGDWDETAEKRLLPARQLDFGNNETAAIFKETHNLGSWVVNYDELLDKRQLLNQNVRIIRYKQFATQGRNLLVSSTAPIGLLRSMILRRTKDLNLELSDQDYSRLADKFIDDAMDISGDIVLRAAKRGRHASELMGVVLSRFLIRNELGPGGYHGWYFLDDYAEWLGQREQHIADILALSPEKTADGKMRLSVIVSEAKYIDHAGLSAKRKESQKQLRDTMRRIDDALFGDPTRLDRGLWLSRFSDLVLNGIQFPAGSDIDLSAWRRAIREGQCEIFPRGYSHVFVSGPTDCPDCSEFTQIPDLDDSFQEIFSRQELRKLVLTYFRDEDPLEIRKESAGENIWRERDYREVSGKKNFNQNEKEKNSKQRETKSTGSESSEVKSRKHVELSDYVGKGREKNRN